MSRSILWFSEINDTAASLVGGKGLHLGLLTRAGLPVPPGFVVTLTAYQEAIGNSLALAPDLQAEIISSYEQLGGGHVAVRSSAAGEDGAHFSFAGQQETILGVAGPEQLLTAIRRCWESLHTERSKAYRHANRIDETRVAMAVVVQQLIDADVAGVLFTRDPHDPSDKLLLIESAPGWGEAVVSGRVMPDRYHVDRESGAISKQHVANKTERLSVNGWQPIPASQQAESSLDQKQVRSLAALAHRIESYYGAPRDIEWAIAAGECFILQARPITVELASEIEAVKQQEIARVANLAAGKQVVWARYNLSEVLPAPTPLTWSIVKHFMSGRGGYGLMFRDLGYDPDPELDTAGFIDLICGRPYVNLCREPKLYFRDFPYGYDFAAIKQHPERGIYPTLITDPQRKTGRFWWRLPSIVWRMLRSSGQLKRLLDTEWQRLPSEVFPGFEKLIAHERRTTALQTLNDDALLNYLDQQIQATLVDFARHSLRASIFAATTLAELEQRLTDGGVAVPADTARMLIHVRPPADIDLAGALQQLNAGTLNRAVFLERFGHRGPNEMELAEPRWREKSDSLPITHTNADTHQHTAISSREIENDARFAELLASYPKLVADEKFQRTLKLAREYVAVREAAKHYLMIGYGRIREVLCEIARRTELHDDLFYLEPTELHAALGKTSLQATIDERKRRRKILLALAAPPVLFSDDLAAIGRPVEISGADRWEATPLSAGQFEGPALVLDSPRDCSAIPPGYVLVCPSTDPAWVPLFLNAGALVMESGGVLSHGAIVAREFGLPAVAGIPNVHRRIQTGQRLHVDGTTGKVHVFDGLN